MSDKIFLSGFELILDINFNQKRWNREIIKLNFSSFSDSGQEVFLLIIRR